MSDEEEHLTPEGWVIERERHLCCPFIVDKEHRILNMLKVIDEESAIVESVVISGSIFPNIPSNL